MKIELKVIPSASKDAVNTEQPITRIYLKAPAVDGKANKALVEVLAKHFNVPSKSIEIIKGLKSRHKIVSIENFSQEKKTK